MNTSKNTFCAVIALAFLTGSMAVSAEVTPEQLIGAVDQMTPEQAYELQQKLRAKSRKPAPPACFSRMAVSMGGSWSSLDTVDLSSVTLSGGDMDIEDVGGGDFSVLWRVFCDRTRVGVRFSSWEASDSNMRDSGYSSAKLTGSNVSLITNCQWIRSESWRVWTELNVGIASIDLETIDTPAGEPTTLRRFDEDFTVADLEVGASHQLNSVLSIYVSGGYRFAESVDLEEGGRDSAVELDASGAIARVGVGLNF